MMPNHSLPIWLLVDYDGLGLYQIQALDDHPRRCELTDEMAIAATRLAAAEGDPYARSAVAAHDRDAEAISARG